jgi:DnaJ-class molecular chaperone
MCKYGYYQVLGINQNATEYDVKKAFIRLAFQYHPELNPRKENERKFREIYKAYTVLQDKAEGQEYSPLGWDTLSQSYSAEETSFKLSLEDTLYEILGVSRDASEQDINKAVTKSVAQYRPILKELGYSSISSFARDNGEKLKKVYRAYTALRDRARGRGQDQLDQDAPSQAYTEEEPSFELSLEDILYMIEEFGREFGIRLDENAIDPLGVLPLGKQAVHSFSQVSEHLLSDVLGIKIKSGIRRRRII